MRKRRIKRIKNDFNFYNLLGTLRSLFVTINLFTSVAQELKSCSTVKQLQVVVRAGLEPGTSGLQIRHHCQSAILLHKFNLSTVSCGISNLR